MKLPWWIPFVGAVLVVLCGCATTSAPMYPRSTSLSMHVSSGTVSTWTERAAEDHLIPDSQVFVSGRGSSAVASLSAAGGLLGGLIGTGINQARNEPAVAPAQDALRLRFNGELELALKAAIASEPARAGVSALVLREYPDEHVAVAPVFGERPARWMVVVLDRKSLAAGGP